MGGGATGWGDMGEGSRDGRGEALWREQLLSELESLGGEWSRCLCHHLRVTGVSVRSGVFTDNDPRGGAEVSMLIGRIEDPSMWTAVKVTMPVELNILNEIAV